MAFNPNTGGNPWNLTVEIALTGYTVRWANKLLVLSDNTLWEGRIKGATPLRRAVGSLLDPRVISPQMRLTIDSSDDVAGATTNPRRLADTYEFANRTVTIRIGQGETAADYDTVFIGKVRFPGGISWDQNLFYIDIDDTVSTDERVLPINKFFPSTYPNAEAKSLYLPIPYVYGSWLSTDPGGLKVKCFQIDSTVGTGGSFKIADHALKQIELVYKNGASVSFTVTSLNSATFTLNVAYAPDTDTITANVRGATDDATSAGALLQSLPDILDDILTTHLGVAAGSIDSAAFTTWEGNLAANDYGRRVIDSEVSSNTLVSELLTEGFADLTVIAGKYYPVYRIVDSPAGTPTYYTADLTNVSDGAKAFQIERDQERVYANQIVGEYRYDPVNEVFAARYDAEDSWAISQTLTRRRRRLEMKWLYIQAGAESRVDRERFVFATETETAMMGVGPKAVTKNPTDQFKLIHSKYDDGSGVGTPFQIREITTDLLKTTTMVRAWNMLNLSPGRWTGAAATTWLLSTAFERATQGYWTDASGYADTSGSPDATSKRSRWF